MTNDPLLKADAARRDRLTDAAHEEISAVLELTLPPSSLRPNPTGATASAAAPRRLGREREVAEMAEHAKALVSQLALMGVSPQSGRYLPLVWIRAERRTRRLVSSLIAWALLAAACVRTQQDAFREPC
jgi:hypothetical protein